MPSTELISSGHRPQFENQKLWEILNKWQDVKCEQNLEVDRLTLTYIQKGEGIKVVSSQKVQYMPEAVMYELNRFLVLLTLMFL